MIFWVIGRNDDWYSFDDSMVLTISSNIPSEIEMLYEIIPVKVIRRFYEHRNIIFVSGWRNVSFDSYLAQEFV